MSDPLSAGPSAQDASSSPPKAPPEGNGKAPDQPAPPPPKPAVSRGSGAAPAKRRLVRRTDDDVEAPTPQPAPAPARRAAKPQPQPAPAPARRAAKPKPLRNAFGLRRVRARRVRRTIRHIDPWSVFKVAILFCLAMYGALLIAGGILWSAAVGSGLVDNVENFIVELGIFDTFEFDGSKMFRAMAIGGFVLAVASASAIVLAAVLFNLISDLTGGIRVSVIEEETAFAPGDPRRPSDGRPVV